MIRFVLSIILLQIIIPSCLGYLLIGLNKNKSNISVGRIFLLGYVAQLAIFFVGSFMGTRLCWSLQRIVVATGVLLLTAIIILLILQFVIKRSDWTIHIEKKTVIFSFILLIVIAVLLFALRVVVIDIPADQTIEQATKVFFCKEIPYVNIYTNVPVDYRAVDSLAPLPVCYACISYIAGVFPTKIMHFALSYIIILLSFISYNELSLLLFNDKKKRVFFHTIITLFYFSQLLLSDLNAFSLFRTTWYGPTVFVGVILPLFIKELLELGEDKEALLSKIIVIVLMLMAGQLLFRYSIIVLLLMLAAMLARSMYQKIRSRK